MNMKFLQTFVITYQSFTNPWVVVDKLLQRYECPAESGLAAADVAKVKLRVCVVFKYWIEHQFFDFDEAIIARLEHFVSKTLTAEGQTAMATALQSVLERGKAARAPQEIFEPPKRLQVPDIDRTPSSLILHFPASDVAEQLTLLDWQLYRRIRPAELLNNAWNSKKLRYRAHNVLELISRANRLSFWVASMVLWLPTKALRAKMIEKMINVAECLRKANNFNTLMSIMAGLGMSPGKNIRRSQKKKEKLF